LAYAEVGAFREESIEVVDLNVVVEKVRHNLKVSIDSPLNIGGETGAPCR
jgi:hypothetical protein